jgi:hydroxymethylbilane synthase
MNHKDTWLEAEVERAVMKELGIGCAIPAGIYAECKGKVRLLVQVIKNGREFRVDEELSKTNAVEEAKEIAKNFKSEIGL